MLVKDIVRKEKNKTQAEQKVWNKNFIAADKKVKEAREARKKRKTKKEQA